jgi:hypothetical protein
LARFFAEASAGLLACCWDGRARAGSLPDAAIVTRRVIERAQPVATAAQGPRYTYESRSVLERLDADGRATTSEAKGYQVTLVAGLPLSRLIRTQGRDLSAEELRQEEAREEKFRQRFVSADAKQLAARKQGLITPDLLDRYQFAVKERVVLSNRTTLVLTFQPKAEDLPAEAIQDKLLNRMAGTLWIEEEDAETARMAVRLEEPISLGWFGLLGSLNQCDISLERRRMPDGVWTNTRQVWFIQCRKLIATVRFRTTEDCRGFRKVAARR